MGLQHDRRRDCRGRRPTRTSRAASTAPTRRLQRVDVVVYVDLCALTSEDLCSRSIVFSSCIVAALGLFLYQLWGRFNVLRAAAPAERFDHIAGAHPSQCWSTRSGRRSSYDPRRRSSASSRPAGCTSSSSGASRSSASRSSPCSRAASSTDFHLPLFGPGLLGGPYLLLKDIMEVARAGRDRRRARPLGHHPSGAPLRLRAAEDRLRGQSHWEAYLILCFIGAIMIGGLALRRRPHRRPRADDPSVAARSGLAAGVSASSGRLLVAARRVGGA